MFINIICRRSGLVTIKLTWDMDMGEVTQGSVPYIPKNEL